MKQQPISEIVFTLLYIFAIFSLSNAIYTSFDDFAGWGGLITVLLVFYEFIAIFISIPFLIRSTKRLGRFNWFKQILPMLIWILPIEMTVLLILLYIQETGSIIFFVVCIIINAIPILLYSKNSKTQYEKGQNPYLTV